MNEFNNRLAWGLVILGMLVLQSCSKQLELNNFQLLPATKPLTAMTLTNTDSIENSTFSTTQLKGNWTMVFFGYTYCPDVCPIELQKLGQMLKRFEAENSTLKPQVLFVSVDPERDHPEQIKQYANYFHPAIQGLTGSNVEVATLASFFGASYNRSVRIGDKTYLVQAGADMPKGSGENYLVNHTSRIFVLNPGGAYIGSFSPPYSIDVLYSDMHQLMDNY